MGLVTAALGAAAVGAIGSGIAAHQNAQATQGAANTMAQATAFHPYGTATNLGTSQINQATGMISTSLNNQYQQNQDQSIGNSNAFGGMLGNLAQTGGLDANAIGAGNQYFNSTQGNNAQLGQAANSAFGALGSFDPTQAGQAYSGMLDQQDAQGQQVAAQGLGQRLFNTGSLGTTGGQGLFGQLVQAQNQQHLGNQIAGQQLGQQQQSQLFGQAMGASDDINSRANQRFTNSMGLLGFGQSNLQNTSNLQSGQLNQALGINSAAQAQTGIGIQAGSAQSAGGMGAVYGAQIGANGQIAQSNAYNGMFQSALSAGMDAYKQSYNPTQTTALEGSN